MPTRKTDIGDFPPAYRKLYTLLQAAELYAMSVLRESRRPVRNEREVLTVAHRVGFLAALARAVAEPEIAELMLALGIKLCPPEE